MGRDAAPRPHWKITGIQVARWMFWYKKERVIKQNNREREREREREEREREERQGREEREKG